MILIREVADAADYYAFQKISVQSRFLLESMGILEPAGPEIFTPKEVKIMNQLFVGIDAGSRGNTACLMRLNGEKHSDFTVQNNLSGANIWIDNIVSALTSMDLEQVVTGMEATGIYGDNLLYALWEDGTLGQFQRKIHVLNPQQVNKFKKSYSNLSKNDDVDAFVIADKLRFDRITKEVYMDDYRYKALRTLAEPDSTLYRI